jgi:hypothetical protein
MSGIQLTTLVVIGTDCTGSCESNYHMIMTMTASLRYYVHVLFYKGQLNTCILSGLKIVSVTMIYLSNHVINCK